MKRIAIIVTVGCICSLSGCASFAPIKSSPSIDLAQKQAAILSCSDSYINCLENTKDIAGFPSFDAEVNKCIEVAKTCSGLTPFDYNDPIQRKRMNEGYMRNMRKYPVLRDMQETIDALESR